MAHAKIDQVSLDSTLCALRQRRGCASPCVNLRVFFELETVLSHVLLALVFTWSKCGFHHALHELCTTLAIACFCFAYTFTSLGLGLAPPPCAECECQIIYRVTALASPLYAMRTVRVVRCRWPSAYNHASALLAYTSPPRQLHLRS